ncbi:hypothetical protein B0T25DRAFT_71208 [Lasiosphaeria hispida]|uniref:Uncharacterized protein n=1 Tax=Lasiosphaeria hispida TaxID=260671 RepID=A0AAJ0HY28_9PEZI|nr:hypothetical protein B0T25DRAFT_71208 [Lasiosphaeria hispida]
MRLTRTVLTLALAATTTTALPVSGDQSTDQQGGIHERQESQAGRGQSGQSQKYNGDAGQVGSFYQKGQSSGENNHFDSRPDNMGIGSSNFQGQGVQSRQTNEDSTPYFGDEVIGNGRQNPNAQRSVNPSSQQGTSQSWSKTGSSTSGEDMHGEDMHLDRDPKSSSGGLLSFFQPLGKGQGSKNQEVRGKNQGQDMLTQVHQAPHEDANGDGRQPVHQQDQISGSQDTGSRGKINQRDERVGNEKFDKQGLNPEGGDFDKAGSRQGGQGDAEIKGHGQSLQGDAQIRGQDPREGNRNMLLCTQSEMGCTDTSVELDQLPKSGGMKQNSASTGNCRSGDSNCRSGNSKDEVHHGIGARSHNTLFAGHDDGHTHQNGQRDDRGYVSESSKSGEGSIGQGSNMPRL